MSLFPRMHGYNTRTNIKKRHPFHHRGYNAQQESSNIQTIDKFGLGVQNEAGQKLTEFCQKNTLVIANCSSNNTRDDSTHRHHQMINTQIRLIIFFAAEDRDALYVLLCRQIAQAY